MKKNFINNDVKSHTDFLQKYLLENFYNKREIKEIISKISSYENNYIFNGINTSLKSLLIALLSRFMSGTTFIVANDMSTALKFYNELSFLTDIPLKLLPHNEVSPYDMSLSQLQTIEYQNNCLELLINKRQSIIITYYKTLLEAFPSIKTFDESSINLHLGDDIDIEETLSNIIELGYHRVSVVVDPGEFSIRGDILDIYPISSDPIRIQTGFDEIESIKIIDIETQRSVKYVETAVIRSFNKISLSKENINKLNLLFDSFIDKFKSSDDEKSKSLSVKIEHYKELLNNNNYFEGIDYFYPFLYKDKASIFDFIDNDTLVFIDEISEVRQKLIKFDNQLNDEYKNKVNNQNIIELPELLHHDSIKILDQIDKKKCIYLNNLINQEVYDENTHELECSYVPCFMSNLKSTAEYILQKHNLGYKILICTEYPQRVLNMLSSFDCEAFYLTENNYNEASLNDIIISKIGFMNSFDLLNEKFVCITDFELFQKKSKKTSIAKKISKREDIDFILSPADLKENDYVVHSRHGIGQFLSLESITLYGQQREYLTIKYFGNDKLYVPVDQINLLSRYRGVGDHPPKLNKMGGSEWESIKKKAEKAVSDVAAELLNLYAERSKIIGFSFEEDSNWQREMEDSFEFVETPDQLSAICDVKNDMESENPMDRLICGDVGYGKTEVAIRAIFKAVLSGKQVAFMVPTTILAQQHYTTIKNRFLPYPMKIDLLSRFRSPKEQKKTISNLITGECDIVVGTHRLLQKDIAFKDLGLVIIDEEHRFGVKNKEQLKQLRRQVDVLSMSATPIPRTLYMALSGIREMSVINTPPVNRLPIKTYVSEFNEALVKSAIMYELERDGQVYFMHNRVQSIYKIAQDLTDLIPSAKIAIGHGQMNEKELEKIMMDFSEHNYDILLCTTIIESGLDIPNVNTIIIDNADKLGLAQLYQLRGRVGRSDKQAYAYCFYRPSTLLTQEAKRRLAAIREFNTLGSGYQIALRDLEIRGIGNILGAQQHGNMINIGFDLYCEMLEDAIKRLKGTPSTRKTLPTIDINITAYIPDEWAGGKEQKIVEYKRLASVCSFRELDIITEEWKDRFGKIPEPVRNLLTVIKIRLYCSDIGLNYVREEPENIRIFTNYEFSFWNGFINKAPSQFSKKTKFVKMPQSSTDGKSSILIRYAGFTPNTLLKFIEELCFCLNNYLKDQKGDAT